MSEVIAGVIDSIYTKTVPTKRGDGTVYHAMVNGNDVNLGFKCAYQEGETVQLNVEHKYGGYQLIQGAPTATNGAANQAGKGASKPASKPAFPTPKNTKDVSIIRQNSMTHASRIVRDMADLGILGKLKEDAYLEKVIETAYYIADFSTGWREEKQAAAMAGYEE